MRNLTTAARLTPTPETRAARATVPQLILKKSRRFIPFAPLLKDFPLLLFQGFHGDRPGRTPCGAEAAANAFFLVFDNRARLAGFEFCGSHSIAMLN